MASNSSTEIPNFTLSLLDSKMSKTPEIIMGWNIK